MRSAGAISDADCITFLKWCLPRVELRWQGYRKVHRIVSKRLKRRIKELGLQGFSQYQAWLMAHHDEWAHLEVMCRIPISRFYRDRDVFEAMAATVLPEATVAAGVGVLAPCAAGVQAALRARSPTRWFCSGGSSQSATGPRLT
jgi:chemotaxis protein methyltransferase CheR